MASAHAGCRSTVDDTARGGSAAVNAVRPAGQQDTVKRTFQCDGGCDGDLLIPPALTIACDGHGGFASRDQT
jgi:hypothetical protein